MCDVQHARVRPPRWRGLCAIVIGGAVLGALACSIVIASWRPPAATGCALLTLGAIAVWVRSERLALEMSAWCACAHVTVRVVDAATVAARPASPRHRRRRAANRGATLRV